MLLNKLNAITVTNVHKNGDLYASKTKKVPCRVNQQVQNYKTCLKNSRFGVEKFNFSLGLRSISFVSTLFSCLCNVQTNPFSVYIV